MSTTIVTTTDDGVSTDTKSQEASSDASIAIPSDQTPSPEIVEQVAEQVAETVAEAIIEDQQTKLLERIASQTATILDRLPEPSNEPEPEAVTVVAVEVEPEPEAEQETHQNEDEDARPVVEARPRTLMQALLGSGRRN